MKGEVGDQMPLEELPLSDAEIAMLRQWVDQGARLTPTSPPAPTPWEAPLALDRAGACQRPCGARGAARGSPGCRVSRRGQVLSRALVSDPTFARRAYLDIWGLLPSPEQLQAFLADPAPDKRDRLVATLLADNTKYAEHWISFWNDLLRNDDGQSYFRMPRAAAARASRRISCRR